MRAADALDYYGLGSSHEYRWTPINFAKGLRDLASDLASEPEAEEQALHRGGDQGGRGLRELHRDSGEGLHGPRRPPSSDQGRDQDMSITQTPAPSELAVTAHATLAETAHHHQTASTWFSHHERRLRSASSSAAACADIGRRRPDVAQSDVEASQEETYRQRLSEFVEAVAPAIEDAHAHSPYRMGVTSAMQCLRAERERLSAEASEPAGLADAEVLSAHHAPRAS